MLDIHILAVRMDSAYKNLQAVEHLSKSTLPYRPITYNPWKKELRPVWIFRGLATQRRLYHALAV